MKVYLSKSMQSNPDLIIGVRSFFKNYFKDIEIVEFKGGVYSINLLIESDVVVTVAPGYTQVKNGKYYVNLGKGVHNELTVAKDKNIPNVIAVCTKGQDPLDYRNLSFFLPQDIKVIDRDWQVNYATASGSDIVNLDVLFKRAINERDVDENDYEGIGFL